MQPTWMFYYQQLGGEESWLPAMAATRSQIIADLQPRYVTVLDVNAVITADMTREDIAALKYRGPLYFDWDATDIDVSLGKFREWLVKVEELGVDLNSLRLYATGSRGFHAELPQELFLANPPKGGIANLPYVYKEIAIDLYVDTLDLRVYTARRGRMWRTPGVQRENGRYKVPITLAEARSMTADDYAMLCSAPRVEPARAEPTLNQKLAVMFIAAEQKVAGAMKKRKDSAKDLKLLEQFKGEWPPSLWKVMQGEGTNEVGFHYLAMQIAITANALGKTEEQTLAAVEPLCVKHESDGVRYNTPEKRRVEIARMYHYTNDNPCYTYNRDALRKCVPAGTAAPDLDGVPAEAGAVVGGVGVSDNAALLGGVFMTETGTFRRAEEGAVALSDVVFKEPMLLTDAVSRDFIGYESEIVVGGRSAGRRAIDQTAFLSRANFQKLVMRYAGGFRGTENDVVSVALIVRDMAMANGGMRYLVSREGLDLVQRPDCDEQIMDLLWITPAGIETQSPVHYMYRGSPTEKGIYHSDLMKAPALTGSAQEAEAIEAFLNVNVPFVMANVVGWMVSCFHRQVYHHLFNQFPLLSLFGQAGCGKTSLTELVMYLHYYLQRPLIKAADDGTPWGISASAISSASIPLVLDEYKPREMRAGRHHFLKNLLRGAYNASTYSKGGMSTEIGSTWRDVRSYSYSAPILFIGESLESETAVQERTIAVPLQKSYLDGRREPYRKARENRKVLSSLGRDIARATFALDFEAFRESFLNNEETVAGLIATRSNDRPVFNLAVVLTGLEFLGSVLRARFGDRLDSKLSDLRASLNDASMHTATTVMPEAAKALNALSLMSRTEDGLSEFGLKDGTEYAHAFPGTIDIHMRRSYVKLMAWSKRKGMPIYFDTEAAFIHGLAHFAPVVDRACVQSPLKESGAERVFRFDLAKLTEEGVEPFKGAD